MYIVPMERIHVPLFKRKVKIIAADQMYSSMRYLDRSMEFLS